MELLEIGYSPNAVNYRSAWSLQEQIHSERVSGTRGDTTLLLEHQSIYTAGKRTQPEDRPVASEVIDVDRGGRITWHGPGQLVGYPIVKLSDPPDVVAHVRRMEQILIDVCSDFDVESFRVDGRSGVWVEHHGLSDDVRKIAAIGVRVSRGVTMHGFALNCDCDLTAYSSIVPCGIADAGVTSLSAHIGRTVKVADVLPHVKARLTSLSNAATA